MNEFESRFNDFKGISHLIEFTSKPFDISIIDLQKICTELGLDSKAIVDEFIVLKSQIETSFIKDKEKLIVASKHFKKLYFTIKSFYPDSYLCEKAFSNLNFIVNQYRSKLNQENIKNLVIISLTGFIIDFEKLVQKMECQISH